MRDTTPWTDKQKAAMLPHRSLVGEAYRTLDWLRDSIRDSNGKSFAAALSELRNLLSELETSVQKSFAERS